MSHQNNGQNQLSERRDDIRTEIIQKVEKREGSNFFLFSFFPCDFLVFSE